MPVAAKHKFRFLLLSVSVLIVVFIDLKTAARLSRRPCQVEGGPKAKASVWSFCARLPKTQEQLTADKRAEEKTSEGPWERKQVQWLTVVIRWCWSQLGAGQVKKKIYFYDR